MFDEWGVDGTEGRGTGVGWMDAKSRGAGGPSPGRACGLDWGIWMDGEREAKGARAQAGGRVEKEREKTS